MDETITHAVRFLISQALNSGCESGGNCINSVSTEHGEVTIDHQIGLSDKDDDIIVVWVNDRIIATLSLSFKLT